MKIEFFDIATLRTPYDLIFAGGDLSTDNLIAAYQSGYFPMPVDDEIGWFSPIERAVMASDAFKPSRSLKSSAKKFTVSIDKRFTEVVERCADPSRPGSWIDSSIKAAYTELFDLGIAHSVEVMLDDKLVGGLYGVLIDNLFAGESMFHSETDASKVAYWRLCEWLNETRRTTLIDAQWMTPHLQSLGFRGVSRSQYSKLLAEAVG